MTIRDIAVMYSDELSPPEASTRPLFFGKNFGHIRPATQNRLLVHTDYPRIGTSELAQFILFAYSEDACAVTACAPELHPWLLFTTDSNGHDQPLCPIPRTARAERRDFTPVQVVRPAMVWLPKGMELTMNTFWRLFSLPYETLLDQNNALECMALHAGRNT